jgi:hypothetical protein
VKPLADLTWREVQALDPETRERFEREVVEPILAPLRGLWQERLERWRALPEDADPGEVFGLDALALLLKGDDALRMRAARRIVRLLDLRIATQRGVRLTADERSRLAAAALFEVAHDGTPGRGEETGILDLAPAERTEALGRLQEAVRERLTQDGRGPAYRASQRDEVLKDPRDLEAFALVTAAEEQQIALDLGALIARANLSTTQRRVVEALLAVDAEEPQSAIAAQLGMAAGTFRAQLDRARRKIRAAL